VPVNQEHRYVAQFGVLDRAVMTLSALSGLLTENTTRGEGWRFVDLGRRIERASQLAELLRAAIVDVPPGAQPYLQILLQVADSSITYRTRYLSFLRTDLVLQLLLVDELNPRSIGFQLAALGGQFDSLGNRNDPEHRRLENLATRTLSDIRAVSPSTITERNTDRRFAALELILRQIKADLHEFSEALTALYLSPAKASRLTASW